MVWLGFYQLLQNDAGGEKTPKLNQTHKHTPQK